MSALSGNEIFDLSRSTIHVAIDIDPLSPENLITRVKKKEGGTSVDVAILSTADFDATMEVDELTISLAGAEANILAEFKNIDPCIFVTRPDGTVSLDCPLDIDEIGEGGEESLCVLEARTPDGFPIRGHDVCRVTPEEQE